MNDMVRHFIFFSSSSVVSIYYPILEVVWVYALDLVSCQPSNAVIFSPFALDSMFTEIVMKKT